MRDSLTVLAILLIGVLTAALVGPYAIDWNSHRALIERRLSEGLGTPVSVSGPIDVKILPTPRFRFGGVAVGDAADRRPRLRAEALEAELSFTALLRGQIQVLETTWVRPRLEVFQAPDGTIDLALPSGSTADRVSVDHLGVRDGTIVLALADGRRQAFEGLDLAGEASSLRGPFKATGTLGGVAFRLATGALDRGSLRVKLHLDGEGLRPAVDLDGTASALQDGATSVRSGPGFAGTTVLTGVLPIAGTPATVPWVLTARVTADRDAGKATDVELRAGTDLRALIADGEGAAAYGASDRPPRATLALRGASLDLDRLAVAPDKGSVAPPKGTDLVAEGLRLAGEGGTALTSPLRLDLSARFDTATLGGQTLLGTRLRLGLGSAPTATVALAVEGPQGALLSLDGDFDPGLPRPVAGPFGAAPVLGSATFRGRAEARSGDIRRTAAWLETLVPGLAAGLAAVPGRSVAARGDVEASLAGVVARDLTLGLDGSSFTGLASLTRAVGTERARLFADLASDALALGRLPDLSGAAAATRDLDLDLALSARAVTVADPRPAPGTVPMAPIAAGHMAFHLTRSGGDLRIDRLALDLDGAALGGTASRVGSEARADLHVSAPHVGPLVAAFGPLLPGTVSTILRDRAAAFSPLDAALTLEADAAPDGTFAARRFALLGRAGGTGLDAALTPEKDGASVALTLQARTDEGTDLLRQVGVPAPDAHLGPVHLAAQGRGSPERGFAGHAEASLDGARLAFDGRGQLGAGSGRLEVRSDDMRPLLAGFGVVGMGPGLPAEAAGDIAWDAGHVDWRALTARLAGSAATGSIAFDLAHGPVASAPALTGRLAIDRLPVSALVALAFVPQRTVGSGPGWSTAPFGPPPAALPSGKFDLRVGVLPIGEGLEARDVAFGLVTHGSAVSVTEARGQFGGGTIGGALALRHDAAGDTLSGHVDWAGVELDAGGWSGRSAGRQDFAATGRSPATLVAGLAGTGTVTLNNAALARTDPTAPGRTLADLLTRDIAAERASGGTDVTPTDADAIRQALGGRLAAAPLPIGDVTFPVTLTSGVLRAGPLRIAGQAATPWSAETAATLDLGASTLVTRTTLSGADMGDVVVVRSGPLGGEPRLAVDATGLVGAVQADAIARAQERIDVLEQDIRERAAFNRRLKAIQADQQAARDKVEADRRAAADALKAEAEQRRAAAEARRAEALRQRAEDARIQADVEAAARRDRRLDGSAPVAPSAAP